MLGLGTRGLSSDALTLRYPALLTLKHSLHIPVDSVASVSFYRGRNEPSITSSLFQKSATRLEYCQQMITTPKFSCKMKALGLLSSRVMQGPSGRTIIVDSRLQHKGPLWRDRLTQEARIIREYLNANNGSLSGLAVESTRPRTSS